MTLEGWSLWIAKIGEAQWHWIPRKVWRGTVAMASGGEGNVVMVPDDSFPSVVVGWRSSGRLWRRPVLST